MITNRNLHALVEQCQPLSDSYLGKDITKELSEELTERLSESRLQIMTFGAYNAGKSSLINALIGEEVAPVADIPETDSVHQYQWNGCTLLDTPGVNAPIEHEEITSLQIERAMLILFVLREGDQDTKNVYQRMFDFIKKGKKLFIVFNHQLNSSALEEALTKLNSQLVALAVEYDITDEQLIHLNIIPVNIKTAMSAKLKNSEKLAQHSGILDFEQQFHAWITIYDNENGYLQQTKSIVKNCLLKPTLKAIQDVAPKPALNIEKKQQSREIIVKQKTLLISKVNNFIRSKESKVRNDVGELFIQDRPEHEINSKMLSICEWLSDEASDFIEQNFEDLPVGATELLNFYSNLNINGSSSNIDLTDFAVDMLKNADHKTLIKNGLLQLRKLKIPGIKGRWSTTFDKWAGKAAPLIQVGFTLWDMKKANDAENEENERIRRQRIQLQKTIESGTENIISAVQEACKKAIETHYLVVITSLSDEIDNEQQKAKQVVKDLELVRKLSDELESITI